MDDRSSTHYEIYIRGYLSDRYLDAFPELQARARNHQTVLTGALPDQSALHGVLNRIEALGLELLEVRRVRTGVRAAHDADSAVAGSASEPASADRG